MSNLGNQLVITEREEVAKGVRLLLATPLITEHTAPDAFDLVRRRQIPLAQWFDYACGWRLTVEPRFGYARLAKVRTELDHTRPARRVRSNRAPFDRRRYTLLCVVAAEMLSGSVTTIGLLADRVKQATTTDPVLGEFDTSQHKERKAYVDVLRLLESYGALTTVDGSTESFVDSQEAKVLYRVDTTLLLRLLSAPSGPSQQSVPAGEITSSWPRLMAELMQETRYGEAGSSTSDVQRNLWLRHSILRRLFDDPVLYRHELSEEQLAYLTSLSGRKVLRQTAEQAGFVLEERAEGWLLVDVDGIATDRKFPDDSGTANVAALLLLDKLVAAPAGLTVEQLRTSARTLLLDFPRWAKTYRDDDGVKRLVNDAVAVLTAFGLAEHSGGLVHALPAAGRYVVTEVRQ